MTEAGRMPTVWMLDPAQLTPYYNRALCDALVGRGVPVHYFTSHYLYDREIPPSTHFQTENLYFRGLEHDWLRHYPRLRQALRGLWYPFGHWQLLRQMRESPPDVLHIQWSRLPRLDYSFIQQVRKLGVPIVHTVHEVMPPYAPRASLASAARVYASADRLILHTQANLQEFERVYPGVDARRVRIIPMLNLPYRGLPPGATQVDARQRLSLPSDARIALFFGAIKTNKGLDVLVRAFADAQAQQPDLHLLIAGLPERPSDQEMLGSARTLPNIHIHTGYVPYGEMWAYHLAADVAIFPYRSITQSMALFTAMDFGLPVIVTNVGGLPEALDGNGQVVPPEDAAALRDALLKVLNDRNALRQMAARSAQLMRERYSPTAVAGATLRVYQEVRSG
jgi:glycosyltransferase involved in cell wall biosynthesis